MPKEPAKINMITQQIRTCNVLNESILDLFDRLPREDFVPLKYRRLAYADMQIPIEHQQIMMSPVVEGRMLEALNIQSSDKILEIGTGTGYMTAGLASLGQHVYSVDIFDDFLPSAEHLLKQLGIENVTLQAGNGSAGWDKQQPYDVIVVTGSLPQLPLAFRQQLKVGGRLFAIVGEGPAMEAWLIKRTRESNWSETKLFETNIAPLLGLPVINQFIF